MEEIDLMSGTPIGKKLMTGAAPSLSRPAWRSSAAWGADDYISKPFRPRDLLARVSAVLRRANLAGTARGGHAG